MNVDEAGREGEPLAGKPLERVPFAQVADQGDFLVHDGEIGDERSASKPVVDPRAFKNGL